MKTRLLLAAYLFVALCAGIALAEPGATTRPATRPTTAPATRPQTGPERPPRQNLSAEQLKFLKIAELTRKSIDLFKVKKYDEAERVINEALKIDPNEPTNTYNLACLKSLTGHPDAAMELLERAADLGFVDFLHVEHDSDLDSLRELPRYKAFIGAKDAYQKKSADHALAELKKKLGDKYIYEIDQEAKLLYAANTDRQTLDAVKHWLGAQAKSQWQQIFEHHPDQYIAVVVPTNEDYHKMVPMRGVEGIYMHEARMLIAHSLGQVMTHEFTHALYFGDTEPLGQQHPIWMVEGMASLFEAAQFEKGLLIPRDNFRLWIIQGAAKKKQLLPLDKLLKMKQPEFMATGLLCYGESASVLLYLYEHGKLRDYYDAYKANFDKDPSGRDTLERITGKPLAEFERDWQKWMLARTPPAVTPAANGPFIGIGFEQHNDGLEIEEVVPKGPADAAHLKKGDVIVGLNEIEVRDQQTFIPMLREFKIGEIVTLKVRRDGQYLKVPLKLGRRNPPPTKTTPTTRSSKWPSTRPSTRPATQPAAPVGAEK